MEPAEDVVRPELGLDPVGRRRKPAQAPSPGPGHLDREQVVSPDRVIGHGDPGEVVKPLEDGISDEERSLSFTMSVRRLAVSSTRPSTMKSTP
jgi:hypothetical protein